MFSLFLPSVQGSWVSSFTLLYFDTAVKTCFAFINKYGLSFPTRELAYEQLALWNLKQGLW